MEEVQRSRIMNQEQQLWVKKEMNLEIGLIQREMMELMQMKKVTCHVVISELRLLTCHVVKSWNLTNEKGCVG